MSFSLEITIWCDGDSCGLWEAWGSSSKRETLRAARYRGWTVVGSKHLCPICSGVAHTNTAEGGWVYKRGEEK